MRDHADQVPHGTLGGYNKHKCRCAKCRAAVSADNKEKAGQIGSSRWLSQRIQSYAQAHAAKWVREKMPDFWQQLLERGRADARSKLRVAKARRTRLAGKQ